MSRRRTTSTAYEPPPRLILGALVAGMLVGAALAPGEEGAPATSAEVGKGIEEAKGRGADGTLGAAITRAARRII